MKQTNTNNREIEIEGVLVPSEWDSAGNVLGAVLNTNTEEEYPLDHVSPDFKDILKLVHNSMVLRGVSRVHKGKVTFIVKDHRLA
ncbi:MAG: hypothetical protein HQK83_01000 [Fibrobacteria bacterium]|nr:hypothetical protein [Fibrobacteria bacterium]